MNNITPDTIRSWKRSQRPIAALTAYDYPTAKLLDEAGIDLLLVGDSLGMVVLGYPDTTHVQLEEVIHHTRAVARGTSSALLVADLPIHSFDNVDLAVASSKRLIDAGAHAVKLEGGQACSAQMRAITAAGIPFVGHIGMLPQHVLEEGGYRIKGRTAEQRNALLNDASAVEESGGFAVVLELIDPPVAAEITRTLSRYPPLASVPAQNATDKSSYFTISSAIYPWFKPKHAKAESDVAGEIRKAAQAYIKRTREEGVSV